VEDGFGRVEEEVVEVGFSDVGWDEEVVLFESADGGGTAKREDGGKWSETDATGKIGGVS